MPPGMTTDPSALFSLFRLLQNVNTYCGHLENIASSGTDVPITALQTRRRVLRLTTGASGGFTITLPSTSSLLNAWGVNTGLVTDGTYGQPFSILNDGIGQTGTLTAGDASTTITGTATIATNTRRDFFIMVNSASAITIYNIGSAAI